MAGTTTIEFKRPRWFWSKSRRWPWTRPCHIPPNPTLSQILTLPRCCWVRLSSMNIILSMSHAKDAPWPRPTNVLWRSVASSYSYLDSKLEWIIERVPEWFQVLKNGNVRRILPVPRFGSKGSGAYDWLVHRHNFTAAYKYNERPSLLSHADHVDAMHAGCNRLAKT